MALTIADNPRLLSEAVTKYEIDVHWSDKSNIHVKTWVKVHAR